MIENLTCCLPQFLFIHLSSGGGFSDIFPIPEYQKEDVEHFLRAHPPPFTAAQFNNSGKVQLLHLS